MKVVFTKASQDDLRRISRGLIAYDPQLARRVVDELREKALDVGEFPSASKKCPTVREADFVAVSSVDI